MLNSLRKKTLQLTQESYTSIKAGIRLEKLYVLNEGSKDFLVKLATCRASKKNKSSVWFDIFKNNRIFEAIEGSSFCMAQCPIGVEPKIKADEDFPDLQDDRSALERLMGMSFFIGITEVTQSLYETVMKKNPSWFQAANPIAKRRSALYPFSKEHPVESVTWFDAVYFCNELSGLKGLEKCYKIDNISYISRLDRSEKEGIQFADVVYYPTKNGYRLPTRSEWMYAARAGTENKWAGTDSREALESYAVYGFPNRVSASTMPVGTKKPNEWGIYDMSGNVAEWCWDEVLDTESPKKKLKKVFCGVGTWETDIDSPEDLYIRRSSMQDPDLSTNTIGFRIVRNAY